MHVQENEILESFLSSDRMKVVVPIPSRKVRLNIEEARKAQVAESATSWMGAKPSVMLLIWKQLCEVANDLGKKINVDSQPPYDPEVYEFVFRRVLKNRHFYPLLIDELFLVNIKHEKDLHNTGSLMATDEASKLIAEKVCSLYPDMKQIDVLVEKWYKT